MSAADTIDEEPALTQTRYRVTIQKVTDNFPFRNREYKNTHSTDVNGDEIYAHVYFDDSKTVATDIYKQDVDEIDLPKVIKAVNRME